MALGNFGVNPDDMRVVLLVAATLLPAVLAVCCRERDGDRERWRRLLPQILRYVFVAASGVLAAVVTLYIWRADYFPQASVQVFTGALLFVEVLCLLAAYAVFTYPTKMAYHKYKRGKLWGVRVADRRNKVENPTMVHRPRNKLYF